VVQNQDLYHNDKWIEVEKGKDPENEEKRLRLSSQAKPYEILRHF
jgi:hypothetical protein